MGQAHTHSKQKLDQISTSLHKIRADLRNGKIKVNDVEKIQNILTAYDLELKNAPQQNEKARDKVQQLIEITSQELDGLKQEVIDPSAFKRGSKRGSARSTKEKRKSTKLIKEEVESIRQDIRDGKIQAADYERVQGNLVSFSQQLSSKNKKSETDPVQKLISLVSQELLTCQPENTSKDDTLRRSSSKDDAPRNSLSREKRSSISERRPSRKEPRIANRNAASTLDDIEVKLEALKSDIKIAESHKEKSGLRFLAQSVRTLMTDLQMVEIKNQIVDVERKKILEKNLQKLYEEIDKIKRELTREDDVNYLSEINQKEKKNKCLHELNNIKKELEAVGKRAAVENFQVEKDHFLKLKNRLNAIEGLNEEVSAEKSKISELATSTENIFKRIEMEERLKQAEIRHRQYKPDLKNFTGNSDDENYKRQRQFLVQLQEYVVKILDMNADLMERKKYLLYNIENNIKCLDQKVKENEHRNDKAVKAARRLSSDLAEARKSQLMDYSAEELQEILPLLTEVKSVIEEKLGHKDEEKVNTSQGQLVTVQQKVLPRAASTTALNALPVQEKELPSAVKSSPPIKTQIESIRKEVEKIQGNVTNATYQKDSQLYKDTKKQLEDYKNNLKELSRTSKDAANLVSFISDLEYLLESKTRDRRSATEDTLMDIMSIGTRVQELGNKINSDNNDAVKQSLEEQKHYLENLRIPQTRTNLWKSRDELLLQIGKYLSQINQATNSSSEEKAFNQELRKIKEKVNRYSGTYRNVLYKSIENDLEKSIQKVDKIFPDSNIAARIKQDIEKTKSILEQKSTKEHAVRRDGLAEIKQSIAEVNRELSTNPLSKEELDKLDARLTLSMLALDNIKDHEEKEKLTQEMQTLFDRIQQLMVVTTSTVLEDPQQQQLDEKQQLANTIHSIDRDFERIKPDILGFVGNESSPNFARLDEYLVKTTLQLDSMNFDKNSELYQLKLKILKELQDCNDILEDRIAQCEEIEQLEQSVNVMIIKIDSFNGFYGDPEYALLDEDIIRLKVILGQLQVCPELQERKETCIRHINQCMKKLDQVAKSRATSAGAGTLV